MTLTKFFCYHGERGIPSKTGETNQRDSRQCRGQSDLRLAAVASGHCHHMQRLDTMQHHSKDRGRSTQSRLTTTTVRI